MIRLLFIVLVIPSILHAQVNPQTNQQADPFVHYAAPDECAMHALRFERQYWRDKRPDTVYRAPLGNPYRPETVESVRKCLSRFAVDKVAERDLLMMGEAYLSAGMDSHADAAFKRLITLQSSKPVEKRAWFISQVVALYTEAHPARISKATEYMKQLDALGAPAAAERLVARNSIIALAKAVDSLSLIESNARAAISAGAEMIGDTRKQRVFDEVSASLALADWYARRFVIDSAVSVITEAKPRLMAVKPGNYTLAYQFDAYEKYYKFMERKPAPVQATYWFNKPDNVVYPAPGKPMLIMFISHTCSSCNYAYSKYRMLHQKYGSKVDMVMETTINGYHINRLLFADKEAQVNNDYFLKYLELPGTLAVWETQFQVRNDGRRRFIPDPNFREYAFGFYISGVATQVSAIIVDKEGRIRMHVDLGQATETRVDNILKEMM